MSNKTDGKIEEFISKFSKSTDDQDSQENGIGTKVDAWQNTQYEKEFVRQIFGAWNEYINNPDGLILSKKLCSFSNDDELLHSLRLSVLASAVFMQWYISGASSSCLWGQIGARLDERNHYEHIYPYVDSHSTLFSTVVTNIERDFVYMCIVAATVILSKELKSNPNYCKVLMSQFDSNLEYIANLFGASFESLFSTAHDNLAIISADTEAKEFQICADIILQMIQNQYIETGSIYN